MVPAASRRSQSQDGRCSLEYGANPGIAARSSLVEMVRYPVECHFHFLPTGQHRRCVPDLSDWAQSRRILVRRGGDGVVHLVSARERMGGPQSARYQSSLVCGSRVCGCVLPCRVVSKSVVESGVVRGGGRADIGWIWLAPGLFVAASTASGAARREGFDGAS